MLRSWWLAPIIAVGRLLLQLLHVVVAIVTKRGSSTPTTSESIG